MTRTFSVSILLSFLLSAMIIAQSAGDDLPAAKKVKVFSKILNEERTIYISLPIGYEQSQKRYPVFYSTDGDEEMALKAGGIIHYLAPDQIPEMIAVFIPNTDRGRDLSVTPLEQLPNSGGAGNFLKFITEELIPYIDGNYRTTDYRILAGYSAGAEFAFYSLISKPESFDAVIAGSLCMFDQKDLLERAEKFFENHKTLNKFLYLPYYEEDYKIATTAIPKLKKIIDENKPKGFHLVVKTYKGRAHVPSMSLFDGLSSLFDDWKPVRTPEITPGNGGLIEGMAIEAGIKGYDTSIRYTLDGTDPTRESVLYSKPITITQPGVLKAKSFRENLGESDTATADFKNSPVFSAETGAEDMKPGLSYQYYEAAWFRLPDTISLPPVKKGIADQFDISIRNKDQGFLFQFEGYINIIERGMYRFYLLSTSRCKLFIANNLIINNYCSKAANDPQYSYEEYSYEVYLNPGYYPIKALYTNSWHYGDDFIVSYEGPGFEKKEIPAKALYHKINMEK